ncbi:MAG: acyltransferase [Gemmatimonadota bacterium]
MIDAFRGVAIIMVMAFHYLLRWAPPFAPQDLYGYDHVYSPWLSLGRLGVDIFFVISGLVIAMTLQTARGAVDFGVRRLARILPALAVAAVLTLVVTRMGPAPMHRSLHDLFASFTFMPERFGGQYVDGAYWSLSVELRFYAWTALSALLLKDRFWIGLLAPAAVSLVVGHGLAGWPFIAPYWPYLLIGVGAWYGLFERRRTPAVVLGLAALALLVRQNPGALETVFIGGWVAAMFTLIAWRARIVFLPWLGRISYSLYLLHQNIGVTLINRLTHAGLPDGLAIAVTVGVMVILAWMFFRLIEQPGQRAVMAYWRRTQARRGISGKLAESR